ncbi:MAG: FG-GAP repeat protein, partial [Planctomycetota bacterium]
RRDDTGWSQEAKLLADDAEPFDFFGVSVSLFADRALIGAFQDDDRGMEAGAAYVFELDAADGPGWSQVAKLLASDGNAGDVFGNGVALDGDVAVVGAPFRDDNGVESGAAYVFRFDGSDWNEEAKLLAGDGQAGDTFGSAVAVNGDVIAIGACRDDDNGIDSGSAYVFRFDGTDWSQAEKLTASDGDAGRQFGRSVSVAGNTVAVGEEFAADRSVYVFELDGAVDAEEQMLTIETGVGFAVSIAGDTLAAGAYLDNEAAAGAGAAYAFGRADSTWGQDQKLIASDAEAADRFGFAVSTDGAGVAVGADLDDDNGMDAGAVYVYEADDEAPPPVADAGTDSMTECATVEGAVVRLDGSGSTDPGGGATDHIVLYEWFEDFGMASETFLGDGEILEVILPLGDHAVTLRVMNVVGLEDTDDVMAAVIDTTAPEISVEVGPAMLWPPNHQMVGVTATVTATDECGPPSVVLESVSSSEPDNAQGSGDGNTVDDIQGAEPGTADFELLLRAERAGSGDGRIYTIVYTATDASGNDASDGAEVRVPKSLGKPESRPRRSPRQGR